MLNWAYLTEKMETALGDIQVPTFLGTPIGNISPSMAAQVATAAIREEIDAHIASIPRVPTNKYDAAITLGTFALIGGTIAGFGWLMYKLDQDTTTPPTPAKKTEV